jgi:Stress responsive A/B Barrel Domain
MSGALYKRMLTHIVLFKLKDRSPENIASTRERMAAIAGKIPQLRSMQVGVNVVDSEHAYDIALVEMFDSVDALKAYQVHPLHVELWHDVMARFEAFTSVDYQL